MPPKSFAELLAAANKSIETRAHEEIKHPELIANAKKALLDTNKIQLAPPTTSNAVSDYVMGKTDKFPFDKSQVQEQKPKAAHKSSFAKLLGTPKPQQEKPEEQSKRTVLYGTGITKKLVASQQAQLEKEAKAAPQTTFKLHTPTTEQPPILEINIGEKQIVLDPSQQAALDGLQNQKYGVLIGAAGTGKTTLERMLVEATEQSIEQIDLNAARVLSQKTDKEEMHVAMCFCAFTGRAVQQMKRALPKEYWALCATIHAKRAHNQTALLKTQWYSVRLSQSTTNCRSKFVSLTKLAWCQFRCGTNLLTRFPMIAELS
jgi:hypothetical protein